MSARDRTRFRAAGRKYGECILKRRRHAANTVKSRRATSNRGFQPVIETRILRQPPTHVSQAEMYVARLVILSAVNKFCRRLIGRMTLDETQEIQKRSFTKYGQQKCRFSKVVDLQQREKRSRGD